MSEENGKDIIQLYPPWRNAITQADLTPGSLLTYDNLFAWFEIVKPEPDTPKAVSDKAELQFLGQMSKFTEALLMEKQIALRNTVGAGYTVVKSSEQGQWGYEECLKELRRAIRKGRDRVIHTNLQTLTTTERQQHADYLAKMSAVAALFTRRGIRRAETPQEIPGDIAP